MAVAEAEVAAAAAAAATAAAQTASLDSLRGLVGPATDAMNQPRAPAAAPSSMYGGLADIRPPSAIDIPAAPRQAPEHEPEPEPWVPPQHMISGSPPSYPGPVPLPAEAGGGQQQAYFPYQPPPAQAPGYQPPPADPSWGAGAGGGRALPPAIGSLASQQQSPGSAGTGSSVASAPPSGSLDGGWSSGAPPYQQPAPAAVHPGAPAPAPGPRTLGDASAQGGYQSNLPPLPWEVPRNGGSSQNQQPSSQLVYQPPPNYGAGRPPPPMSDKERAWHAANDLQRQQRASAPAPANWPQQRVPAPSPAPVPSSGSRGGGGSGSSGRTGRPTRVIKVYGDGHCMYRSVACHLNPDIASLARNEFGIIVAQAERPIEEVAAISLRNRVASYMESHWDEFPTVLEEER